MRLKSIIYILFNCFINLLMFTILRHLSYTKYTSYCFNWTAENNYLYIWVLVLFLVFFKKYVIAYSLSIGNLLGVIAGQHLGDYIITINLSKITSYTSNEEAYHLNYHYGIFIWSIIVIVFFIIGIIVQYKCMKKTKKAKKISCI